MSAAIKRWDSDHEGEMCDASIDGGPGEYVLYADYAALEALHQQLGEALMSALAVFDSMDVYRRYVPVRDLMSAALAATEPR